MSHFRSTACGLAAVFLCAGCFGSDPRESLDCDAIPWHADAEVAGSTLHVAIDDGPASAWSSVTFGVPGQGEFTVVSDPSYFVGTIVIDVPYSGTSGSFELNGVLTDRSREVQCVVSQVFEYETGATGVSVEPVN